MRHPQTYKLAMYVAGNFIERESKEFKAFCATISNQVIAPDCDGSFKCMGFEYGFADHPKKPLRSDLAKIFIPVYTEYQDSVQIIEQTAQNVVASGCSFVDDLRSLEQILPSYLWSLTSQYLGANPTEIENPLTEADITLFKTNHARSIKLLNEFQIKQSMGISVVNYQ